MNNFLPKAAGMSIAAILLLATACTNNRGTVERPLITAANTNNFSIEKIELNDSATVLHGVIHFQPKYWVRIAKTSVIKADGKDYAATGIDGMDFDEQVWMPDSGIIHFTMTFPAIPATAESIDFSEGTDDGWQLWGIDLTGKAGHNINTALIPADARKPMADGPLPEPKFTFDTTVVNIHMAGYRPEMGNQIGYVVNTMHGQYDAQQTLDSLGNTQIKVALSGPAQMFLYKIAPGRAMLSPGDTMDLYVDTHIKGLQNMAVRDNNDNLQPDDYKFYYSTGYYGNMDLKQYGMQFHSGNFGDYRMNGDQYTDYIINQYNVLKDSVDTSDSGQMNKEFNNISLQAQLIYAASNPFWVLAANYYAKYPDWNGKIPSDSINVKLSPENIKRIAALIDFNNPKLVMTDNAIDLAYTYDFWKEAGINSGIIEALNNYNRAYAIAERAEPTDDMLSELRKSYPSMADEVAAHNNTRKALIESLDQSMITPTPEVAPAKILDAIIAPHKGKVVMADLWNTWCGPCRSAIAQNEPAKNKELSSDDIVWIYIADESSPMPKYISMIKEIRGIHYRLNEEQINTLRNQFEVDGIPYYILVDRNGKATGRPDLRDHSAFKKTLLDEVAK